MKISLAAYLERFYRECPCKRLLKPDPKATQADVFFSSAEIRSFEDFDVCCWSPMVQSLTRALVCASNGVYYVAKVSLNSNIFCITVTRGSGSLLEDKK